MGVGVRIGASRPAAVAAAPLLTDAAHPVAGLVARYLAELEDAGMPDPLSQSITVAAVLADLCRLAGEPVPADVALALEPT